MYSEQASDDVDIRLVTLDLQLHFAVAFIERYRHGEFISDEFPYYVMLVLPTCLSMSKIKFQWLYKALTVSRQMSF